MLFGCVCLQEVGSDVTYKGKLSKSQKAFLNDMDSTMELSHVSKRIRTLRESKQDKYEMCTNSSSALYESSNNSESNRLSNEDYWKWPNGYQPSLDLKNDFNKLTAIKRVQDELDSSGINYRELSKATLFSVNKKTICRYLEANQWNPQLPDGKNVSEQILSTIQWRIDYPVPIYNRNILRKELQSMKYFTFRKSKTNNPILYLLPARETTWNVNDNILSLLYTLERAIQSMDVNCTDIICIVDCKGVGMLNTPSYGFISGVIEIMGRHMPRRLKQLYICNVSSFFFALWNMIKVTLSEMTLQKISILNSSIDDMRSAIENTVDLDDLLTDYGGNATMNLTIDEYLDSDKYLSGECHDMY